MSVSVDEIFSTYTLLSPSKQAHNRCSRCDVKLGFFRRKQNCEMCGYTYCKSCIRKVDANNVASITRIQREKQQPKSSGKKPKHKYCISCANKAQERAEFVSTYLEGLLKGQILRKFNARGELTDRFRLYLDKDLETVVWERQKTLTASTDDGAPSSNDLDLSISSISSVNPNPALCSSSSHDPYSTSRYGDHREDKGQVKLGDLYCVAPGTQRAQKNRVDTKRCFYLLFPNESAEFYSEDAETAKFWISALNQCLLKLLPEIYKRRTMYIN